MHFKRTKKQTNFNNSLDIETMLKQWGKDKLEPEKQEALKVLGLSPDLTNNDLLYLNIAIDARQGNTPAIVLLLKLLTQGLESKINKEIKPILEPKQNKVIFKVK